MIKGKFLFFYLPLVLSVDFNGYYNKVYYLNTDKLMFSDWFKANFLFYQQTFVKLNLCLKSCSQNSDCQSVQFYKTNGLCSSYLTKPRNEKDFKNETNSVIYIKKMEVKSLNENCQSGQCDRYNGLICENQKCICSNQTEYFYLNYI